MASEDPPPSHLALCLLYPSLFTVCLSSLQACERDGQCGFGLCCAVSLWLRGLRMCVPRGVEGDECHPFSHKVCVGGVGGWLGGVGGSRSPSSRITASATRALTLCLAHTCFPSYWKLGRWWFGLISKCWQVGWALEKLLITAAAIDLPHLGLSHSSLWSCGNGGGYFCQRHVHLWIQTPKEQLFFFF